MQSTKIFFTVCAFAMFFLFGQNGFAQNAPAPGKGKGNQEMKETKAQTSGTVTLENDPIQEQMKGKGQEKKAEGQAKAEAGKARGESAKAQGNAYGKNKGDMKGEEFGKARAADAKSKEKKSPTQGKPAEKGKQ